MSEAIIGTDSVVGFANGYHNGSGHLLTTTIDRADQTRSIVQNSLLLLLLLIYSTYINVYNIERFKYSLFIVISWERDY